MNIVNVVHILIVLLKTYLTLNIHILTNITSRTVFGVYKIIMHYVLDLN